jgi:hypothetical protein
MLERAKVDDFSSRGSEPCLVIFHERRASQVVGFFTRAERAIKYDFSKTKSVKKLKRGGKKHE